MAPSNPINYVLHKRDLKNASKPTAVAKITSRPYINPQIASPLFSALPAEIRSHIFYYALLGYPDPTRPYSKHSYWYRPGYTHSRAIAVALLLTCRRVYLETDLLPVVLNEHIIWRVDKSRIPPKLSVSKHPTNYLLDVGRMKVSQRNAVRYVHLFTQQSKLEIYTEKWLAFTTSWPEGGPEKIRITIRHTDWWYNQLGENSPLALDPKRKHRARIGDCVPDDQPYESKSWGSGFASLKGLKKLEIELETTEAKRMELDTIIENAHTWRFPLGDGNVLVMDEESTRKSFWTGSKHFKGLNAPNIPAGLQLRRGIKSKPRSDSESEELRPEDTLDYYVVLLAWRTQSKSEHDDVPEAADAPSASSTATNTARAVTNTTVAPPTTTAPRGTYNRSDAIPTYYG